MRLAVLLCPLLFPVAAAAQWAEQTTSTTPPARTEAAMAFDTLAGQTVLFGGAGVTPFGLRNDTWLHNGADWIQATPAASPTGRFGMAMAYDSARNVAVLYGGMASLVSIALPNNQTWEWDGANWNQRTPNVSPPGLVSYGLAYDSARQRVVLYGGSSNPGLLITSNQTWEYDGTTWAQVATANNPGPLQRPGMCYHPGLTRTILFGGINPQTGGTSTTWLYDGVNWMQLPTAGTPPAPRFGPQFVHDALSSRCILHGGAVPATGAPIDDTWAFDGSGWRLLPTALPSTRTRHAMAYDLFRQKIVLHGGVGPGNIARVDTWLFGAHVKNLGPGCAGITGVPLLAPASDPRLGGTFATTLTNLAPGAGLAAVLAGFTVQNPAVPLDPYGMPGCVAHTTPDVVVFLPVLAGTMHVSVALPNDPGLFGVTLHQQGLSLEPGVNLAGLLVSNAITATLGF